MGGMVGQRLWDRTLRAAWDKLVLCNTVAKIGTADGWNARISEKVACKWGDGSGSGAPGALVYFRISRCEAGGDRRHGKDVGGY